MRLLEQPHRPPCPGRGDRRPEAGGLEWRGRVDRRGEDQATVLPAGRGHPRLCLWAAGDVREPMRPVWRERSDIFSTSILIYLVRLRARRREILVYNGESIMLAQEEQGQHQQYPQSASSASS